MWAVGISYLMMGSVPYWVKKLNGKKGQAALSTYKNMFQCGVWVLVLWCVSLFVTEPYRIVLPVLPVIILGLWMLKFIKELNTQMNGAELK